MINAAFKITIKKVLKIQFTATFIKELEAN